jgi:hypothetical protein
MKGGTVTIEVLEFTAGFQAKFRRFSEVRAKALDENPDLWIKQSPW